MKGPTRLLVSLDFGEKKILIGTLCSFEGRTAFRYDPDFLDRGFSPSPFHLPLVSSFLVPNWEPFDGLHGAFNDSLPDGWGRLLLDREMKSRGVDPLSLSMLERLSIVGTCGGGALIYEPEGEAFPPSTTNLSLEKIARACQNVLAGGEGDVLLLRHLGGSSAGARPKVSVFLDPEKRKISATSFERSEEWIIKFPAREDGPDSGRVEYAYSLMARDAGIVMADTHLFETSAGAFFGTKRFDRIGKKKRHVHSISGLLHADHRLPCLDYKTILKAAYALIQKQEAVESFFRLAVFNVLAHNRDDHSKNFAFLMDDEGHWEACPAFDLTYSHGAAFEHSTSIMGNGRNPNKTDLMRLAEAFSIDTANKIFDEVSSAVRDWKKYADRAKVSKESLGLLKQPQQKPRPRPSQPTSRR